MNDKEFKERLKEHCAYECPDGTGAIADGQKAALYNATTEAAVAAHWDDLKQIKLM